MQYAIKQSLGLDLLDRLFQLSVQNCICWRFRRVDFACLYYLLLGLDSRLLNRLFGLRLLHVFCFLEDGALMYLYAIQRRQGDFDITELALRIILLLLQFHHVSETNVYSSPDVCSTASLLWFSKCNRLQLWNLFH